MKQESTYFSNEILRNNQKKYIVIACEILHREICLCAAKSKHLIDIKFMPKKLHDQGECTMSSTLQKEIDKIDAAEYDAILLGYGLCNNGIRGLHASLPIVVVKAHDCITLLLGSRDKYQQCFNAHPGAFYKSSGWIERDTDPNDGADSITSQLGINRSYQDYVKEYGEENAAFLVDQLGDWFKHYKEIIYIDTNIGDTDLYRKIAKEQANQQELDYKEIAGSTILLQKLFDGQWDNDFLIIPPHHKITPSNDQEVITCL